MATDLSAAEPASTAAALWLMVLIASRMELVAWLRSAAADPTSSFSHTPASAVRTSRHGAEHL